MRSNQLPHPPGEGDVIALQCFPFGMWSSLPIGVLVVYILCPFFLVDDDERHAFMMSLPSHTSDLPHTVVRNEIFVSVMMLY